MKMSVNIHEEENPLPQLILVIETLRNDWLDNQNKEAYETIKYLFEWLAKEWREIE
jgi:hypothetical protein